HRTKVTRKPPLPPKPKPDHIPFSARLKTLRKDRNGSIGSASSSVTPAALLQTRLQSTISKRIRETTSREGASLLNNIEGQENESPDEDEDDDEEESEEEEEEDTEEGDSKHGAKGVGKVKGTEFDDKSAELE